MDRGARRRLARKQAKYANYITYWPWSGYHNDIFVFRNTETVVTPCDVDGCEGECFMGRPNRGRF